jgi:predicted nucleotidyltransferase
MADHAGNERHDLGLDIEGIREMLAEYPLRCGLLYGSHARGTPTTDSDVDVAVAFEEGLSSTEQMTHRSRLTADLMSTLGTNDVDVADLDAIRPAIGASALRTGRLLLGDPATVERYLERFENETPENETTGSECVGSTRFSTDWRGRCERPG